MIGVATSVYDDERRQLVERLRQKGEQPVLFVTQLCHVEDVTLPILLMKEIWKFNGRVIATCETSTKFLENCPVPLKRWTTCANIKTSLDKWEDKLD